MESARKPTTPVRRPAANDPIPQRSPTLTIMPFVDADEERNWDEIMESRRR